jgi:hypothetical protein
MTANGMLRSAASAAMGLVLAVVLVCPAWAYEEGKVEAGGTVSGKVVYKGQVPMRKIVPTKDTEVCGGVHDVPLILVGKAGGVKDAVVYIKDVEKGKPWPRAEAAPVLDNSKCSFVPHVQVVRVGGDLAILNSDPVLHNTHGFLDNKTVFNVAMPLQGMKVEKPLKKPGLVRVDCDAHGWMRGWVYAADNPYYALSGSDGGFVISDVPPGDYTLTVWQEETGPTERKITVKLGGKVEMEIELKK